MSTQDDSKAIPLAFAHEQSPVRLLELPPALLSLVKNSVFKGSSPVLKIKASPPISSSDTPSSSTAPNNSFAVLTTDTETFTIRNVHSSNSIFILKPALIPAVPDSDVNDDGDTDMADSLEPSSKPGVVVSSTCAAYLELLPQKPNTELILKTLLVEYTSPSAPPTRLSEAPSKQQIILDTPASDAEFKIGWLDILGFEMNGWALRLSSGSALDIFRSISTIMYATNGGGNGEWRTEGVAMGDIIEVVDQDGELEDWPKDAIQAVVRSSWEQKRTEDGSISWIFNLSHAAKWIGKHILVSNPSKSFTEKDFLELWKNTVPADCTDYVDLKQLEGLYTQSALGVVRYIHGEASTNEGAATGSGNTKKKKWHEKFAAGKKK
ncbi:hypothetical protein ABW19_dt0205918 [Dactylella cylindrospora]|nr:hypothetical protein ABW19_dt0205918 [Dactylella cylindrospora]